MFGNMNMISDALRIVLVSLAGLFFCGVVFAMARIGSLVFRVLILRTVPFDAEVISRCKDKLRPLQRWLLRIWWAALVCGLALVALAIIQEIMR